MPYRLVTGINMKTTSQMSSLSGWEKESSSTISEWWQNRIENLYASDSDEEAEALYKEFSLDDD